jgi:hypothetical protein
MRLYAALVILAVGLLSGCDKSNSGVRQKAETKIDPCETLRQLDPHCDWSPHWEHSGPSTNAIDGTKTEFLSLDSSEPDGSTELRICFENGQLCRHGKVGVGVMGNDMIAPINYENEHSTSVRTKFDDEKPARKLGESLMTTLLSFPTEKKNNSSSSYCGTKNLFWSLATTRTLPGP